MQGRNLTPSVGNSLRVPPPPLAPHRGHAHVTDPIRFDDGASYERYMGVWSQLAGAAFLDWLALPARQRWLDVGCGNGAFTELLAARGAPATRSMSR